MKIWRFYRSCSVTAAVQFVLFIMPVTCLYSLWIELEKLLVNEKITASCQTNMSPNHHIKRYKQHKWTLKNCLASKFSKTIIPIRFNRLHVCPSVPDTMTAFFCICYVIYSFFSHFEWYISSHSSFKQSKSAVICCVVHTIKLCTMLSGFEKKTKREISRNRIRNVKFLTCFKHNFLETINISLTSNKKRCKASFL